MERLIGSRVRAAVESGLIVVLLVLWTGAAGSVAASDDTLELRYRFSWAGVPIAVFGLRHMTNTTIYQTELAIETTGLADQLFPYRALALATGAFREPHGLTASRFRSTYTSPKKNRQILIRFDPDTGDVLDLEITKRGEPERSKVPASLQKGVTDPLTALMKLRHRLPEAPRVATDRYTEAIFDGRRRFDLEANVLGRGRAEIGGRSLPVLRVEVGLKWIAGSDADDLEPAEADEDRLRLELLLSDDERRLPLRLRTLDSLLTAQIEILPECLWPQGCPAVSG